MSLKIFEFDSYLEQGPRGDQYTHSSTTCCLFKFTIRGLCMQWQIALQWKCQN